MFVADEHLIHTDNGTVSAAFSNMAPCLKSSALSVAASVVQIIDITVKSRRVFTQYNTINSASRNAYSIEPREYR